MKVTSEQARAIQGLHMDVGMNSETCEVKFMLTFMPQYGVEPAVVTFTYEAWDANPVYCIARAIRDLTMAEGNEEFREKLMNPTMAFVPKDFEFSSEHLADDIGPTTVKITNLSDVPAELKVEIESVELPFKGQVHREPNQNEDGTIGNTGRFL